MAFAVFTGVVLLDVNGELIPLGFVKRYNRIKVLSLEKTRGRSEVFYKNPV